MTDVVIAKYNEDISWLAGIDVDRVFIYDKGSYPPPKHHIPLANVGREADTYLQHIIRNYDNLGDYTVFLQGNPHDHLQSMSLSSINFRQFANVGFANIIDGEYLKIEYYVRDHTKSPYGLPVYAKMTEYFGIDTGGEPMRIEFARGAQFVCSRDAILRRPKKFYEHVLHQLHRLKDPAVNTWSGLYTEHQNIVSECIDAWTLERMWPTIFGDVTARVT